MIDLKLDRLEMLILFFAISLVVICEMFNTAIEKTIDMVTDEYHPLAKIAKDVAAGGVLIAALNSVVVGYMIFYDKAQAMKSCEEDPSLIFTLIKDGYSDIVYELIKKNVVSINTYDNMGNDVMMKLLKYRQYDLVINLMTKRDWKVNHQNLDGNTFGHILASDCSLKGLQIIIKLLKKNLF